MNGRFRTRNRGRRRAGAVALLLLALLVDLAGLPGPRSALAVTAPGTIESPIARGATVFLLTSGTANGQAWYGYGYGVVIDPAGLILAPASVVAPEAPGLALSYVDPGLVATIDEISIGVFSDGSVAPSFQYAGEVLAADGYLDLAVLALSDATTGQRLPAGSVSLPSVPLAAAPPTDGQAAVVVDADDNSATGAAIAELVSNERIPGGPAVARTDVFIDESAIPGQYPILDTAGALLAFGAFHPYQAPLFAEGRPVALAQPLIDASRSGLTYTSPYVVPGTGQETFEFVSWQTALDPCSAANPGSVEIYPSGVTSVNAMFNATGFTEGEDLMRVWFDPVKRVFLSFDLDRWLGADRCVAFALNAAPGATLSDGAYGFALFAGGHLRMIANEQTRVGGAANGSITVTGRILDTDTGQPLEGAFFTLLKPGVDPVVWLGNPQDAQVLASGSTDEAGEYALSPAVLPGTYGFVVQAFGYFAYGGALTVVNSNPMPDITLTPLE